MTVHPPGDGRRAGPQDGSALVAALGAILLLTALGLGLVTLTNTERLIAANFRGATELRYAAEAGLARGLVDVRRATDLTLLIRGAVAPSFADGSVRPRSPWGADLDLLALTAALQAESDAARPGDPNAPRWQLLAYGPLSRLSPAGSIQSLLYVVAWVADDPGDADGDPLTDSNGVVVLAAVALGPSSMRRMVGATVSGPGRLGQLTWQSPE